MNVELKKWFTLLLCAALTAGPLSGCGGGAADTPPAAAGTGAATDGERTGEPPEEPQKLLASFTAEGLDGSTFTQDDVQARDVTIINFWATTCGPCIDEMPDLAAYAGALPENVQLVTVCLDGSLYADAAKDILAEAGFEGITLTGGDGDFLTVCGAVQYTPTTIFVDSGGVLGGVLIGGQEDLFGAYTEKVNDVLEANGKAAISPGPENE